MTRHEQRIELLYAAATYALSTALAVAVIALAVMGWRP